MQARRYKEADLDESDGELEVDRLRLYAGRSFFFEGGHMLSTGLSHEMSSYDFGGNGQLGVVDPFDDVTETTLHTMFAAAPQECGIWFATLNLTAGLDDDADFEDSYYLEGGLGWMYPVQENLKLGLALFGRTELEESGTVFPFPLIEWQISEEHRIGIVRSSDPGLGWAYTPNEEHEIYASFDIAQRQYKIDDDVLADAAFVDEERGIRTGWMWTICEGFRTDLFVGVAQRTLSLDVDDDEMIDDDLDPAGYIGLSAAVSF